MTTAKHTASSNPVQAGQSLWRCAAGNLCQLRSMAGQAHVAKPSSWCVASCWHPTAFGTQQEKNKRECKQKFVTNSSSDHCVHHVPRCCSTFVVADGDGAVLGGRQRRRVGQLGEAQCLRAATAQALATTCPGCSSSSSSSRLDSSRSSSVAPCFRRLAGGTPPPRCRPGRRRYADAGARQVPRL